ncbi:MAG: PHP domain-containing protein, partial [Dongiaceae bacterium]
MSSYAELQVTTNFSFLRGASHPPELALAAAALGHAAIAATDRNTLAGVVRAHAAAKEIGLRFVVGARLDLQDAPSLLVYPTDRAAYGRLSRLLTTGKRRAPKGECHLILDDVLAHAEGQVVIALPPGDSPQRLRDTERKSKKTVMPGLDPGIHRATAPDERSQRWIAGTSPAMTPRVVGEFEDFLRTLAATFPRRAYLAVQCLYRGDDARRLTRLSEIAK